MTPRLYDLLCLNRKYLIYNLVRRNTQVRYRKSYLGVFWTVLIPASQALIFSFIFQFVMKVSIENYITFVLAGLIPWAFFSSTVMSSMESLVANHGILNKVPIPPFAFPLAEVLTGLINLAAALPILIFVAFYTGVTWSPLVLLFPALLLILVVQAYAIGLMFSYWYVYFRDLRHLVGIALQMWFYLTPVLYKPDMIPPEVRQFTWLNPVFWLFEGFHSIALGRQEFSWTWLIHGMVWALALLIMARLVSNRLNSSVVEMV